MSTVRDKVKQLLIIKPLLNTREITSEGIDRKTIKRMADAGELIRISRGLYCSPEYIPGNNHSIIEAQKIIKQGVVCLLSALAFHEIGSQNPSQVWMAIPSTAWKPSIETLPVQIVRFNGPAYEEGIIEIELENDNIKIYNIPKTIADCFKYRNKIGLEPAIEALKDVIGNKRSTVDELLYYADICRVRNVITPYLESII